MADDPTKVLEKTATVTKEITPELQKQLDLLKKITKENADILKIENDRLRESRLRAEIEEKSLEEEKKALKTYQKKSDLAKLEIKRQKELRGLQEGMNQQDFQKLEQDQKTWETKYQDGIKEYKQREKILKLHKESLKAIDGMEESTENLIGDLTGITSNWKKGFFGKLAQSTNVAGGFRDALSNMGAGIKKTITPANVLGSSMQKVQESTIALALSQDSALAGFNKSTGAAGKYDDVITEVGYKNQSLGIDTEAAANAVKALKHEFTEFTNLSKSAQKEVTKFAATMEQFGVSSEATAKNIEFATRVMGMNTDEAMTVQKELAATALALGKSPQELAEGFQQASPRLAEFGSRAVDVFKDLAEAAKATGLSMESLLGIMEGFDTFEGAATKVGKLNALLGGNKFDSMEMVMAEGVEKFKLLRQGIERSGISLDQMNRFQKKAIADAAGLKDVADLSKLLSGELEKTANASEEMGLSQKEMADMAQKSQDVLKQLKLIVSAFAVSIRPVVVWVREAVVSFLEWSDANKGLIPVIVTFISVGWLAYKMLTAYRAVQVAIRGTTIALTVAQGAAIGAQQAKTLADAKNTLSAGTNAGAVGTQTIAIQASGKAAKKASPALLYWAVVIGVVGAVATALTYAFAALIDSLSSFFKMLLANSDKLFTFAAQLTVLSLAMVAMGLGAIAAAPAIALLSGSFLLLSFSLALIKTEDLQALGDMFMGISKVSFQTAGALFVVAEAIRQIAEALDEVPERKAIAFAATMHSTTRTPTAAASQNTGATRGSGGGQQTIVKQPIIIELDGRKMGKYVLDIVSGEIQKARA